MNRRPHLDVPLEQLLLPENSLEKKLLTIPEFRLGLEWGEPRFGHPEGLVGLHVREVLDNIERIPNIDAELREKLRIIAFAHDTFKYLEDKRRPRDWSKHHGALAKKFLSKYTNDQEILTILETHDDAYYAWNTERKTIQLNLFSEQKRLKDLLETIGDSIQLYYLFFKCDTQTGDKTQASLKWFEQQVTDITIVPIREKTT